MIGAGAAGAAGFVLVGFENCSSTEWPAPARRRRSHVHGQAPSTST